MSVSQHPVALRLERHVGGATKLLATVMALPLIDGIFPALVLAGALSTPVGILETGLLIFGGSATMAVILAEMDGTRREQVASVLLIGALVVPLAALQAAIAPTLAGLLDLEIFQRFAGLVILTIAAKTASAKIGDVLPSPSVIIALGLIASVSPSGAELAFSSDPTIVARGAAAAAVGVGFALFVALAAPQLRGHVNIDRFRFGSAVALGVLALPILGILQTDAPIALAVLIVTGLFAYDPDADPSVTASGRRGGLGGDSDDDPDGGAGDRVDVADGDVAGRKEPRGEPSPLPIDAPEAPDRIAGVDPSLVAVDVNAHGAVPRPAPNGGSSGVLVDGDPANTARAPAAFGLSEEAAGSEADAGSEAADDRDREELDVEPLEGGEADDPARADAGATRAPWL
ncbi:hypothetical protein SAMN05216564_105120 [Halopenitus persicus]|uniref:Uncharacterized protein n=1 Tax=Halopenitus persicus TaxID=1048396 RepID=A0A1H3JRX7_9EURY|nr:DUF5794 domain-containing protein [Halopenitus persicus]SDY42641.1 hypothetical protein SAMN05216564_105120 [Halopenitus persicus]